MSFDPQAVSQAAFNKAASFAAPDSGFLNGITKSFPSPGSLFVNPVAAPMAQLNTMLTMPATVDPSALTGAFQYADSSMASAATAASSAYAAQQAQFTALASKAQDFTTVMSHVTTATYPPNLSIPTSLGGITGGTLPNISQIMNTVQGEHALAQQQGTTSPTNACSSLLGVVGNLGSGVSSSITSLLGTSHASDVQNAATGMSSAITDAKTGILAVTSAASQAVTDAETAVKNATADTLAAAQAALAQAQSAVKSVANSAISSLQGAVSSAQSSAAAGLAAIHSTIDGAMSQVSSMAASVEASVSNQVHMATATMMRNLTESSPCMANFFQNSGLVPPTLNSLISSSPSAGQAAANKQLPTPTQTTTDVPSDAPQITQPQKSALQDAVTTLTAEIKNDVQVCNGFVDAFNAWMASVNYQTIKNAQNDSPAALAAYQALKEQAELNTDYLNQASVNAVIKQNKATLGLINTYVNASTVADGPTDNKWIYQHTVGVGTQTVIKYADWQNAARINALFPNSYV